MRAHNTKARTRPAIAQRRDSKRHSWPLRNIQNLHLGLHHQRNRNPHPFLEILRASRVRPFLQRWASCRPRPPTKGFILWTPYSFSRTLSCTWQDFATLHPPRFSGSGDRRSSFKGAYGTRDETPFLGERLTRDDKRRPLKKKLLLSLSRGVRQRPYRRQ